jgi:hypothetical protein
MLASIKVCLVSRVSVRMIIMLHEQRKVHRLIYSYLGYFCFRCISEEEVLMRSADFEEYVCGGDGGPFELHGFRRYLHDVR